MRIAVLSDIHSNAIALQAVLKHAMVAKGCEKIYILGDLIGYGALPVETLQAISKYLPVTQILEGNHEEILYNSLELFPTQDKDLDVEELTTAINNQFPGISRRAVFSILMNYFELEKVKNDEQIAWFFSLIQENNEKISLDVNEGGLTIFLSHGTYKERDICYCFPWKKSFMVNPFHIEPLLRNGKKETKVSFVGHTHIPMIYKVTDDWDKKIGFDWKYGEPISIDHGFYVINPGSVGFPRDGDTRASYGILETNSKKRDFTFYRVEYKIETSVNALIDKGYGMDSIEYLMKASLPSEAVDSNYLDEMMKRSLLPGE